jgi:hypothetical protein
MKKPSSRFVPFALFVEALRLRVAGARASSVLVSLIELGAQEEVAEEVVNLAYAF